MSDALQSPVATFFLGLLSGWLLIEVTEWRRVRSNRRELRRALIAELETTEVLVSIMVTKYARYFTAEPDVHFVAQEFRWYTTVGRKRLSAVGLQSHLGTSPSVVETATDADVVKVLSLLHETIGNTVVVPVLESVLNGGTGGFASRQIQALGMVRWQCFLLEQDVEWMKSLYNLSFTVTDETNHGNVLQDHQRRSESYAQRSRTLLSVVRAALAALRV